jgi:predicted transcriptional regulator
LTVEDKLTDVLVLLKIRKILTSSVENLSRLPERELSRKNLKASNVFICRKEKKEGKTIFDGELFLKN